MGKGAHAMMRRARIQRGVACLARPRRRLTLLEGGSRSTKDFLLLQLQGYATNLGFRLEFLTP